MTIEEIQDDLEAAGWKIYPARGSVDWSDVDDAHALEACGPAVWGPARCLGRAQRRV